jgi:hypothetical protein
MGNSTVLNCVVLPVSKLDRLRRVLALCICSTSFYRLKVKGSFEKIGRNIWIYERGSNRRLEKPVS